MALLQNGSIAASQWSGISRKRPRASSHLTRASGCTAILSTWTDLAAACLESFWNLQPFAEVLLAGGL